MDGFTDYFSANSMYAAWQAGIEPVPPYVEMLDDSAKWIRIVDDMGFPAGLARTMVVDLTGKLPSGSRFIRITTNLKIYWDRIRVDNSAPQYSFPSHRSSARGAKLRFPRLPARSRRQSHQRFALRLRSKSAPPAPTRARSATTRATATSPT